MNCYNNQLTSLDVRNGNNTNYTVFYVRINPNLYCIDVDDVAWADTNWTTVNGNIDSTMSFSTNCTTAFGCLDSLACNYDSIATINNSSCAYPSLGTSSSDTACDSYTWEGQTVTTSQGLSHIYTNAAGCDSIHTLSVTINNSSLSTSSSDTACDTYTWEGQTVTTSQVLTQTYTNTAGCDSTHNLSVTINNSPNTPLILGNTQTSFLSDETYAVSQMIGSVFNWQLTGGNIITGQNTNVLYVLWGNNSGTFELSVIETDINGCIGDVVSLNVNVMNSTNIEEHNFQKKIIKTIDVLGRETKGAKNEPLFYIYDDGTVEKRITLE